MKHKSGTGQSACPAVAGNRKLRLPRWAAEMLRRRYQEAEWNDWGVMFTSPAGHLRDPSNTQDM